MQTARAGEVYKVGQVLHMAMELGAKRWLLVFSGAGRRRRVWVRANERAAVLAAISKAKAKLGLAAEAPVVSCYEAGRNGHWLHRWLLSEGIDNREIDAASIATPQRGKRLKTDRIDGEQLVSMLERVVRGERRVWSEVRVPSREAEDAQRCHRERARLLKERTAHRNRIQSLLVAQGLGVKLDRGFARALEQVRSFDGQALGPALKAELRREWQRYVMVCEQIRQIEREQLVWLKEGSGDDAQLMRRLWLLCGVGERSVWLLVRELFGWRRFANRRELAALVGLTPTPYASGIQAHEQGISKAGNAQLRAQLIELAWSWLRFQPGSALSRWYQQRFGAQGKRSRRIGIVGLARKLLIALWRYLEQGLIPEGARLRA